MPTVADYDIVSDTAITLSADSRVKGPKNHDFPLETPGVNVDVRALLSFMLSSSSAGITFRMFIVNGRGITLVGEIGEGDADVRALQKVIGAGVLQPNGNTLRIEVTSGFGTFDEIVLWYQTNV
jgi:hypothetical protein